MKITIDKEFQALIPPLQPEERIQLESNIKDDGCRDPLVVWFTGEYVPPRQSEYSGVCKEDGCKYEYKDVPKSKWVMGDGRWECPQCGYGIAPVEHEAIIIDGHNRYEICTRNRIEFGTVAIEFDSRDDAKIWIIKNQFGRRNLQPFVRINLALELEPLIAAKAIKNCESGGGDKKSDGYKSGLEISPNPIIPIDTREEVAKIANSSSNTVAKVKIINKAVDAGKVSPEVIDKLRSGEVSINRVVKDVKEAATAEKRTTQRKEAAAKTEPQFFDNVHIGDFRKLSDKVADGSLSLIFTDPPYDKKAEELFEGLAEFAADKLAEGGSLVMYLGHLQLPAAFLAFNGKLRHWWTCACVHEGGKTLMREYGIRAGWKPMLWFVKGTRDNKQNIVSDVVSGTTEKSHHDWQQDQSEAEYWIDNLCPPDGIVCDPFLGGGTTATAAIALNRKWVGFEIDHDQACVAMGRCKK